MIDAYLSKNDPDTYSKIEHLVNLTSGGKKRKPKKVTKPRKPKKVTKPRKPKKVTKPRKPKKVTKV